MRALIFERNKHVSRRLVRYFVCAGFEVQAAQDPDEFHRHLKDVGVVAADASDGELLVRALAQHPAMRGILWSAEPLRESLRFVVEMPQISNICGRRDRDTPPPSWEVLMVARRLLHLGKSRTKFSDFLSWGYSGFQEQVTGTTKRDEIVDKVPRFVERLGAPTRVGELFGELAHEMLMNAMFDAPVDERGKPKYALDRKAAIKLSANEQPIFRVASDGAILAAQVIDPFGRLQRQHIFSGLARGLESGQMDTSNGGAGLGITLCHNATVAMFYDVIAGEQTTVTGIFDLELNLREFKSRAKSLHFFHV